MMRGGAANQIWRPCLRGYRLTLDGNVEGNWEEFIKLDLLFNDLWRRGWDSNPRYGCPHNGFRDRPNRPLWHLSDPGAGAGHAGRRS